MSSNISRNKKKDLTPNAINTLIADFQTALMLQQAIENAKYMANQAESDTLNKFSNYKQLDTAYVKPQDLPLEEDKSLTHASLNSHLQKVQSKQIEEHGLQTIYDLEQNAKTTFLDKKITIKAIDKSLHPFHNHWYDQRIGQYFYGNNKSRSLSGKVVDINLKSNYIVIKPSPGRQLVNRALKEYLAEVINPATGQSMINIQIG